ncbi:MAG: hypothetical protein QOJ84_3438 [Bradyrhizobium sp.]|nr:hypothetical protein [Bradyrhizobium sp.]
MATIRAALPPRPSAICCRYWWKAPRPRVPVTARAERRPRAPEPASPARPVPGRPAIEPTPAFAEPPSAAQAMGTRATASPARRLHQMLLEKVTDSYFGPVADEIVNTRIMPRSPKKGATRKPRVTRCKLAQDKVEDRRRAVWFPRTVILRNPVVTKRIAPRLSRTPKIWPSPTAARSVAAPARCCCCRRPSPNNPC